MDVDEVLAEVELEWPAAALADLYRRRRSYVSPAAGERFVWSPVVPAAVDPMASRVAGDALLEAVDRVELDQVPRLLWFSADDLADEEYSNNWGHRDWPSWATDGPIACHVDAAVVSIALHVDLTLERIPSEIDRAVSRLANTVEVNR